MVIVKEIQQWNMKMENANCYAITSLNNIYIYVYIYICVCKYTYIYT